MKSEVRAGDHWLDGLQRSAAAWTRSSSGLVIRTTSLWSCILWILEAVYTAIGVYTILEISGDVYTRRRRMG